MNSSCSVVLLKPQISKTLNFAPSLSYSSAALLAQNLVNSLFATEGSFDFHETALEEFEAAAAAWSAYEVGGAALVAEDLASVVHLY
ncbi:hypothetical protein ACFX13_029608 [Malus domestica]